MVGKRKRDATVVSRSTTEDDEETTPPPAADNSHDIFRKFFEAQFEPVEPAEDKNTGEDESDEGSEDDSEESDLGSEWGGVSGEEEENIIEVVEHRDSSTKAEDEKDKKARKAFMTAKPPSSEKRTTAKRAPTKESKDDGDKEIDADHLKNDLALQRLLKESHLLESADDLAPTGKNRLKALDMRMQTLGAKSSLYHQNMPSSHRRGIQAKASMKDEKRRRDAKENGIILEKPEHKSKASAGRRERGVGGPSVGKFSGGTLNLSKQDISAIQGSSRSGGGRRPSRGKGKTRGRR